MIANLSIVIVSMISLSTHWPLTLQKSQWVTYPCAVNTMTHIAHAYNVSQVGLCTITRLVDRCQYILVAKYIINAGGDLRRAVLLLQTKVTVSRKLYDGYDCKYTHFPLWLSYILYRASHWKRAHNLHSVCTPLRWNSLLAWRGHGPFTRRHYSTQFRQQRDVNVCNAYSPCVVSLFKTCFFRSKSVRFEI